jgi:nucleoside-diphosphate-sugar epimerase
LFHYALRFLLDLTVAKILITGANGFIGSEVCKTLLVGGHEIAPAMRTKDGHSAIPVGNLTAETYWGAALNGCDSVIHLAARVHVMNEVESDALAAFRVVNVDGTLNLARQAVRSGVRRFIYISSVKVNGESTSDKPFSHLDVPNPVDAYGISKYEAEHGLRQLAHQTGLELVIVRPPLVYGPGVRANFLRLLKFVHSGLPLPLSGIKNMRSMVAVENLVDVLVICCSHPSAPGNTFFVSDGADLSTPDLLRLLARSMGRRSRLFSVPISLVSLVATLTGKSHEASRLLDSLQVDITSTKALLGWEPRISVSDAIDKTVADFLLSYYPSNS